MNTISFSSNIKDRSFLINRHSTKFTVLEGKFYPQNRIAKAHQAYLDELSPGRLVSVNFHGFPTPLIKVDGGVVHLVKVKIGNEEVKGSSEISGRLGIGQTREPLALRAV